MAIRKKREDYRQEMIDVYKQCREAGFEGYEWESFYETSTIEDFKFFIRIAKYTLDPSIESRKTKARVKKIIALKDEFKFYHAKLVEKGFEEQPDWTELFSRFSLKELRAYIKDANIKLAPIIYEKDVKKTSKSLQ